MTAKPATCECTASEHAITGVKARGTEARVCGVEIEGKNVKCPPCAMGNHARIMCELYVPKAIAPHLDRRCARCGFEAKDHARGIILAGPPPRAYGRVAPTPEPDDDYVGPVTWQGFAAEAIGQFLDTLAGPPNVARLRRWLARLTPAAAAPVPPPDDGRAIVDDVHDIELATGTQVVGIEPVAVMGTVVEGRRPCARCGRGADDLPAIASRARGWEFTRCPRCHRSTLQPAA